MTTPDLTVIETLKPSQITLHALTKILFSIGSVQSLDLKIEACATAIDLYDLMLKQRIKEAQQ